MLSRAAQDGQVMVESSDKAWSTGEGNGRPLQDSYLENPMNSMRRQKVGHWRRTPGSVGAQYAIGDQRTNNSRKNEETEPKQKHRVHESRQIGSGQTGDGKSECRHSSNQRTKMDWNG